MANEWNKTAFVEFETMLRRRLRSGAAPVVACAGFDLDAASAYLEGALGGSYRAGYESHLAGCAACRRHLIELSRLAQTVPRAGTQPATVTGQTPAWVRCREIVAGWFDLSAWNLKWQMVGAAGAAFVILIAALSAQSRRQVSDQAGIATTPSATPATLAEPGGQQLQSPTSESSPQYAAISDTGNLIVAHREQSQFPVPTPSVGPKEGVQEVAARELPALSVNESSGEPPVPARPGGAEAMQNLPSQPSASVAMDSLAMVGGSGLSDFRDVSKEQATKESVQGPRIIPSHGYNPMNPGQIELYLRHQTLAPDEEGRVRPVNPQSPEPQPRTKEPLKLPGIAKGLISRIKSKPKSESERKKNAEASEDESPKLIPIRGKRFRFEKDMLIDVEYKPERDEWNVWVLERGGDQYKKVLADYPLLKEFFDRGPILIVWKDRIYKVTK